MSTLKGLLSALLPVLFKIQFKQSVILRLKKKQYVKESTLVYYDSLKNNPDRPFSEYPDLRNLGEIEFHEPKVWQKEVECGCMVVLRYWQLFHGKQYTLKM